MPGVTHAAPPSSPADASALTRSERLDRLPFTRAHGKLLVGSGVGWALDAMDVGLMSFVVAALAQQWHFGKETSSLLLSGGFVGMAIGASMGGLLADRIGRRQVFALTLLVYGLATGASALAGSVAVLMALRFVVGLGLGAELPVASTLVSEYSPRAIRGRMVVILESFWALGWILAALIGFKVIPTSPDGWRYALLVGIVPTLYAVVVRAGLPESVRFLERKGRFEEAERAVRVFESSAGIAAPTHAAEEVAQRRSQEAAANRSGRELWAPGMRRRTAALWIVWFMVNLSYYGAFSWLPSLLIEQGHTIVKSFEYTLYITLAQIPGYALAAHLIERIGRRVTLAGFLVGSAAGAFAFGSATGQTHILIAGMVLSFFNLGAWGALYAVSPEIYPTAIRGRGAGSAAAFGRLASIIAPLSVPFLLGWGGQPLAFGVFAAAFGIAAAAALALPELRDTALD